MHSTQAESAQQRTQFNNSRKTDFILDHMTFTIYTVDNNYICGIPFQWFEAWNSVEEFLYDTSKSSQQTAVSSQKKNSIIALKLKCNNPSVDYRNSGTGFHVRPKILNAFKIFEDL